MFGTEGHRLSHGFSYRPIGPKKTGTIKRSPRKKGTAPTAYYTTLSVSIDALMYVFVFGIDGAWWWELSPIFSVLCAMPAKNLGQPPTCFRVIYTINGLVARRWQSCYWLSLCCFYTGLRGMPALKHTADDTLNKPRVCPVSKSSP